MADNNNISMGVVLEALNDKVDLPDATSQDMIDYVIERGGTADKWYRLWKSGWLEQGGFIPSTVTDYEKQTITFLKPFSGGVYSIFITPKSQYGNTMVVKGYAVSEITSDSFVTYPQRNGLTEGNYWRAEGFAANPQQ